MLWLITACSCTDLSDSVSFSSILSSPLHNFSTQLSASIEGAIQYTYMYIQYSWYCRLSFVYI